MRRGPTILLVCLCLVPALWFTALLLTEQGSDVLRIALVAAFVVLAVSAGIPALRAVGVRRKRTALQVGDFVNLESEFEGPADPPDDQGERSTLD